MSRIEDAARAFVSAYERSENGFVSRGARDAYDELVVAVDEAEPELERDYALQRKELYWQAVEAEHRAERAEARAAELETELERERSLTAVAGRRHEEDRAALAHVADIVREWSDVGASYEAMRAIQKAVKAYVHVRKGES